MQQRAHVLAVVLCLCTVFLLGPSAEVLAQASVAELPALARKMGLTFALPRLDELRFDTLSTSDFQPYDFSWSHRGGKFVLRYQVLPHGSAEALNPAIAAAARVVHCAKNEEENFIGRFRGGSDDLARLGAEWAYFWDYAPKSQLGHWRRCYQASYFVEGKGLVHAWLLYNDEELFHSEWVYVVPFDR